MTPAEHLASLAVVEKHLIHAMDELRFAVEALAESDAAHIDHTDASHEITKASLDLYRIQQDVRQAIKSLDQEIKQ